jgi:hypothetical protein
VAECTVFTAFSLLLPHRLFQQQNKDVAIKLGTATVLMFTFPIAVFYICFHHVFNNNEFPENWSGGMAVLAANIVVAGYVISAFSEEDDEPTTSRGDSSGPRSGIYKERTD